MTKEIEVQILVDGRPLQGTSFITVENGKVDYSLAEEHFFEIVRKWEKDWIEEANEEEHEHIVDHLTAEQEDILKEEHAKDYFGLDDDMPDAFDDWLMELPVDELKSILKL